MTSDNFHNQDLDQKLDNRLAEFADRVITHVEKETRKSEEAEMVALEETILRFHAAVKAAQPDAETAARIEAQVKKAWKAPAQPRWKIWLATFQSAFKPQVAFAAAALAVVLFVALWVKPNAGQLSGTAFGFPIWAPFLFILAVVVILFLLKKDR